jgi:hypothetical protein
MSRKSKRVYKHPDYVAIYRHTFKSPAWKALSVGARATYLELAANYNTKMMNAVYLSARTGAERLGASKNTVIKWLRELQHYGFIALVRSGSLGVYGYGLAQKFRLTDRPYGNTRATYDFQNWTGEIFDPEKQNPVPARGTPRTTERDIEKSVPANSLCPTGRDIETASDRPTQRDVTSLTSWEGGAGGMSELRSALREWTTPVLTEIRVQPRSATTQLRSYRK